MEENKLEINQQAPKFEAQAFHDGEIKTIKLDDYNGKWVVLVFYPADFTFVCPTELEEMAEMYEEFKKLGAEVISVSTDTAFSHKAWHDHSKAIAKIKYPMAADPTGKICKFFDTYIVGEGLSVRATFIINPDGVIKAMDLHDNSIGRNAEEIHRKLDASVYVSQHEGEVCPASWKPGKKTLKPGMDLIGKI